MKKEKAFILIILVVICVLIVRLIINENGWICVNGDWVEHGTPSSEKPTRYCLDGEIGNFKECVAAGNPVMESYPRKCNANNQTFTEIIENFCINGENSDVCTNIYEPVCGFVEVQCITAPCPPIQQTFSNSCFACQNKNVLYWIEGECDE